MTFFSTVLIFRSAAYRVVVFPDPVGPVTRMIPCGFVIRASNRRNGSLGKPSSLQPREGAGPIKEAHHHPLPVDGGDGGDPDVHVLPPALDPDPPVLGQAPLGDVHP